MLRTVRAVLLLTVVLVGIAVAGLGLAARGAPALGHALYAIRSGSMAPSIGVGSLVAVDRGRSPAVGDVAAFGLPNGTTVTHRVTRIVDREDGRWYEIRGDANAAPDPALVPQASLVGRVGLALPALGYLLAVLSMPLGAVAAVAIAGALVAAIRLLDEVEGARRIERERTPVLSSTPTR